MRILCVTQNFPPIPGGIAVFLHNLCAQLYRLGHQVDVLTPARGGCAEADVGQPYRVFRYVSPQRLSSIVPIRRTLALHRQHHYDVVFIGHFMTTHALGALASCWLWGVPYVILSHGSDLTYSVSTRVDKIVASWLFSHAALMLANSRYTVDRIRGAGYKGPTGVLHPGVDAGRFHPGVDTTRVGQKYGLHGHRVLLTVGRLVPRKNVEGVLRALPKVIEQVPDLLYLVVGEGEDKKRRETLSEKLGLCPYVRFLGYVDNDSMPSLYCASDLFVMPSFEREGGSDYEGFGIVFSEANACGKPVIGGRSGGTPDAVIDGETGLLVDPHNVDEIAAAIIRLLADRDLARRLGENGRRRMEQELSWKKVGERLRDYLESVVARKDS